MTIRNRQSERFDIFSKFDGLEKCVYDSFDEFNIDKLLEWDNYEIINGQIDELRTESLEWLEKQV